MKKIVLLISMLCFSATVFGQQVRRVNYKYYEMDADDKAVVELTSNFQFNVYLFDKVNFQNYQSNKSANPAFSASFIVTRQGVPPIFIVPPNKQQQHWYLVVDNRVGQPFPAGWQLHVFLFSKSEELPANDPSAAVAPRSPILRQVTRRLVGLN